MSFYDPSYYSIYDLIDSLNNRRRVQQPQQPLPQQFYPQQYAHPAYSGYRTTRPSPQPYYYFNAPRDDQREDVIGGDEYDDADDDGDDNGDDELELSPRDALYRSLYGDGPYRSVRPSKSANSSNSIYRQPSQQRPPIKRQPSYPRVPHPAESVVDLLNLLGANIPYPEQEQLPTVKTIKHETPSGSPESGSGGVAKKQHVSDDSMSDEKITPKEVDELPRRPPLVGNKKISSLNLHASAPSPKLDPLQVSKPQLSKSLPFSPPINVYDTPTNYLVVVSIPGSDKNSFHVDFHPTSHDLVVKGEIKNKYYDADSANDGYVKVSEQRFGSFERNIKFPTLPEVVDEEIKAVYSNGLLEITIPKVVKSKEPKTKRRIEIEEVEDEELLREKQGI